MWQLLSKIVGPKPTYRPGPPPSSRIIFAEPCIEAVGTCIAPEIQSGHEGVAYLIGQTNGISTLAVAAIRPEAITTPGSFHVSAPAMSKVVRIATKAGLQVVGQIHTHPGKAYHSDGDVEGALIAYSGFVSVVLPDYGERLPSLDGAAFYIFKEESGFVEIGLDHVSIIKGKLK